MEFIRLAHENMTGGHLGRKRTEAQVQRKGYWPGWSEDVGRFLHTCQPCMQYHRGLPPRLAQLKPMLVGEPFERVSIDITGPHPRSLKGHVFLLTVMDHFTKWAEAIPLRNHTATTVARAHMVNVFSRFGVPLQLLSDRGMSSRVNCSVIYVAGWTLTRSERLHTDRRPTGWWSVTTGP